MKARRQRAATTIQCLVCPTLVPPSPIPIHPLRHARDMSQRCCSFTRLTTQHRLTSSLFHWCCCRRPTYVCPCFCWLSGAVPVLASAGCSIHPPDASPERNTGASVRGKGAATLLCPLSCSAPHLVSPCATACRDREPCPTPLLLVRQVRCYFARREMLTLQLKSTRFLSAWRIQCVVSTRGPMQPSLACPAAHSLPCCSAQAAIV